MEACSLYSSSPMKSVSETEMKMKEFINPSYSGNPVIIWDFRKLPFLHIWEVF